MARIMLVMLLILFYSEGYAQKGYLVLKKRERSVQFFWKDSHFTFQLQDGQWLTGILTKITTDSFYLTREIIRYNLMGTDTLHYHGLPFSLKDVYAVPTKRELIEYDHDEVKVIPGHEKFVWIRNGFIFQAAGAGYVGLNVVNDLIRKDPPFTKTKLAGLGIGSAVFLVGEFLHLQFDPYLHIGKKYHLETVVL